MKPSWSAFLHNATTPRPRSMSSLTFVTPIPFSHHLSLLTGLTPRRCRQHRFHLLHPRASVIASSHHDAEVETLETRLRSLDAPSAADLAYVTFATHSLPPTWQQVLDVLSRNGIIGPALSRIASRIGIHALFSLSPAAIPQVLEHLSTTLSLTDAQRNRIITHRPDILRTSISTLSRSTDALLAYLKPRDLKHVALRWPGILLLPSQSVTRVTSFLSSRPCLLSPEDIRCLLRRAPWVLVFDIDRDMAPVLHWLRDELLPHSPDPLAKYLLASPQLLGIPRGDLHSVMHFLKDDIHMDVPTSVAVVRQFPPILTCSVETALRPAVHFLSKEVGLENWQVSKVVRAFPAVLTLDVDTEMRVIVKYFRDRGMENVARLVMRLPPILGYDLETDVIPKMEYVEKVLGLSVFDILRFPAYFSYDLRKRIEPRTRFMQYIGVRVAQIGLNVALPLTDGAFCRRIGASVETYCQFRKAHLRWQRKNNGAHADDPALENSREGRKSIANASDIRNAGVSSDEGDDSYVWGEYVDTSKRRKKRFRATLTRMPWVQMGEAQL